MLRVLFIWLVLFGSSISSAAEDESVYILFRGIHLQCDKKAPDFDTPETAVSPAAVDLHPSDRERLIGVLESLQEFPDTLNSPPAETLLEGIAQRYVNNYFQFKRDFDDPGSDLYKELDHHGLDTAGHFFVSTSFSFLEAALFAAGTMYGKNGLRKFPRSEDGVIGWVDVFAIPQNQLEKLLGIVINKGHSIGSLKVTQSRFLRAQEVLIFSHIPAVFHKKRIPLALDPVRRGLSYYDRNRSILHQTAIFSTKVQSSIDELMAHMGYARYFCSPCYKKHHPSSILIEDKESIAKRRKLEDYGRKFSLIPSESKDSVKLEIKNFVSDSVFSEIVSNAINYYSRTGRSVVVSLNDEKFYPSRDAIKWLATIVKIPKVTDILWDAHSEPSFAEGIDEETKQWIMEELYGPGSLPITNTCEKAPEDAMIDLISAISKRKAPLGFEVESLKYGADFINRIREASPEKIVTVGTHCGGVSRY